MAFSPILCTLFIISSASESFLREQAETNDVSNPFTVKHSNWFNQEGTWSTRNKNWKDMEGNYFMTKDMVVGAKCKGKHCGNSSVMFTKETEYCTYADYNDSGRYWLTYAYYNAWGTKGRTHLTCYENEWLAGWRCKGLYCEIKLLYCSERVYRSDHFAAGQDCQWEPNTFIYTDWFRSDSEEEETSASCPENTYAIGLQCKPEKYCPEMRLKCAAIGLPM